MKIGVIGTGSMGSNHIRVLSNIPEVDEIAISDINSESLMTVAKRYGIDKTYSDCKKLICDEKLDGIIIATQPDTHKDIAIHAMRTGINVLVEKPIAHSLDDAAQMIDCAKETGVVFTVGHIERFNPVVSKIKEFLDNKFITNVYLVNTHRVGPFPKRLLGKVDGVLIDLAVHDLDIISYLCGNINSIRSHIMRVGHQEIYVMALIELEKGGKGSAEFSWISPRMVRTIEIYGDEGMILGDYFNQEVWFFENDDYDSASKTANSFFRYGLVKSGKTIKYPIFKQEPLMLELTNFIRSIEKKEESLIKPEEAYLALKNALSI